MANQLASAIAAQLTATLHDAVNRAATSVAGPSLRSGVRPAASAAYRSPASASAARFAASASPARFAASASPARFATSAAVANPTGASIAARRLASPQMTQRNVAASAMAAKLASTMTLQLQKRADELLPQDLVDRLAQEIVKRVSLIDERRLASAVVTRLTSASPTAGFDRAAVSGLQARRRSLND